MNKHYDVYMCRKSPAYIKLYLYPELGISKYYGCDEVCDVSENQQNIKPETSEIHDLVAGIVVTFISIVLIVICATLIALSVK